MPKDLPLLCCSNSRQSIEKTENDLLKIYLVAFYLLGTCMMAISLFVFFLEVISSGKNTAVPITAHRCPLVRKVNGNGPYSVRYGCSLVYHGSERESHITFNILYIEYWEQYNLRISAGIFFCGYLRGPDVVVLDYLLWKHKNNKNNEIIILELSISIL